MFSLSLMHSCHGIKSVACPQQKVGREALPFNKRMNHERFEGENELYSISNLRVWLLTGFLNGARKASGKEILGVRF
jgi:hypothetical protein